MKRALRVMLPRVLTVVALLAGVAASGRLWASVPINEHRDVTPDGLISISLVAGTVEVTGWDKPEVDLTGSLSDDEQKLEITGGKDSLKIEVRMPEKHHYSGESNLVLRLPKGSRIDVETVSGDIRVSGMKARVQLNSVSGSLEIKGSPTEVKLNTVSGDIDLDDGESLENADLNSVSGALKAHLRFHPGGSFRFETVSGSITLHLPAGVNADFEVSTFSGSITSDFGDKPAKTSQYLPSQELEFKAGNGGARVKVNAFSGPVRILKD